MHNKLIYTHIHKGHSKPSDSKKLANSMIKFLPAFQLALSYLQWISIGVQVQRNLMKKLLVAQKLYKDSGLDQLGLKGWG